MDSLVGSTTGHVVFGPGTVVAIDGDVATVSFARASTRRVIKATLQHASSGSAYVEERALADIDGPPEQPAQARACSSMGRAIDAAAARGHRPPHVEG